MTNNFFVFFSFHRSLQLFADESLPIFISYSFSPVVIYPLPHTHTTSCALLFVFTYILPCQRGRIRGVQRSANEQRRGVALGQRGEQRQRERRRAAGAPGARGGGAASAASRPGAEADVVADPGRKVDQTHLWGQPGAVFRHHAARAPHGQRQQPLVGLTATPGARRQQQQPQQQQRRKQQQ